MSILIAVLVSEDRNQGIAPDCGVGGIKRCTGDHHASMDTNGRAKERTRVAGQQTLLLPGPLPPVYGGRTGGKCLDTGIGGCSDGRQVTAQCNRGTKGATGSPCGRQQLSCKIPGTALSMVNSHGSGSGSGQIGIGRTEQDMIRRAGDSGTQFVARICSSRTEGDLFDPAFGSMLIQVCATTIDTEQIPSGSTHQ